jgi:hypothetical protein
MRRVLALAVAAAFAAVLAGSAGSTSTDIWKKLRRPLHIPRIAPGAACPTTDPKAFEAAPAFPVLEREGGKPVLRFSYPPPRASIFYGSPWSGQKVMWVVRAKYRGPLLIRGRQLDGPHELRFERGQIPGTKRWIRSAQRTETGMRRYPSSTRIRSPGCYAYQLDGLGFSRVIVFQARVTGPENVEDVVAGLRARGLPMEPVGDFPSLAFDQIVGITGQRFTNPGGDVVLWQFPSFDAVQLLLILEQGRSLYVHLQPSGLLSASIFCCPYVDVPPPHWYRSGSALALYLGDDADLLRTMGDLLGEQFAGV